MACLPCARLGKQAAATCTHDETEPLYVRVRHMVSGMLSTLRSELDSAYDASDLRAAKRCSRGRRRHKEQWPTRTDGGMGGPRYA